MFDESKHFLPEELEPRSASVPEEVAGKYIAGKLIETAPVVHEGDKSVTYRCFERDEVLPGLDGTKLRIDYRHYREKTADRHDQLRFEYTQADPSHPDGYRSIAEMHLAVVDPGMVVLEHRYVKPELRTRSGIGSRLLLTVEEWLHQVAHGLHRPVTIGLQTGQESVIRWAQKMGYIIREDQKSLLDELTDHPELFVQDEVIVSEESKQQGVVKDVYTFRKDEKGRYMENAIRLTFEKHIQG